MKKKKQQHQIVKTVWCGAAWFLPPLDGFAVFLHLFGGVAFLRLLWVEAAFPLSSDGWCCFPSPPLGGAAFPLFCWVVLLSSPSFGWCCCFFLILFMVLHSIASSGWRCFFSIFGWVVLLGFPFSGWGCCLSFWWDYFSPVFCWVVLLGPLFLGIVLR